MNPFGVVNTQWGCEDEWVLDRGIWNEPNGLYWNVDEDTGFAFSPTSRARPLSTDREKNRG